MLGKFKAWVQANLDRLGAIGLAFTLSWLWVMFVLLCVNLYGLSNGDGGSDLLGLHYQELLPYPLKAMFGDASLATSFLTVFIGACVAAPLLEEAFRMGLCEICEEKAPGGEGKLRYPFLLIAGSGLGFGLLHGGGYFSVLIQGAVGMALGLLYFRLRRNPDGTLLKKRWIFLANVAVHAAYNFGMIGVQVYALRLSM